MEGLGFAVVIFMKMDHGMPVLSNKLTQKRLSIIDRLKL